MDITSDTMREEVRREYIFQFCGTRELALVLTEQDSVVLNESDGSLQLTFREPAGRIVVNLQSPQLAWSSSREFTVKVPIKEAPTRLVKQFPTIDWPSKPLTTL